MAWNQPGNNGQDRDPWGSSKPGGNSEGNGNKGGRDQGPPDLDDIFRKLSKKLGGLGGGKGTGSGGGSSSQGRARISEVVSLPSQRQRSSLSGLPAVSTPSKKRNAA
ncbi:FtsH protease regulator HflK [Citrobacter koseri]|uniref:FtsH protease regulator HflK n=1 Tax=Citrobacter koseri TaxID=545 RepID=A0A3S4M7H7_CITKO|nr:FtsH protease regulator HflK [Citrobacter koseri]